MSRCRELPPEPGKLLFENLFTGRDGDSIFALLSDGLTAVLNNTMRLMEDVELLIDSERYASAFFLLTTAREEMAKSYILLDACRLDFSRHKSVLRKLCQAFYNHIPKHAYIQIVQFLSFRLETLISATEDMGRVKILWDAEVTRWWPASYESGEPGMPHDTYFAREMPLYVDFIDYDQQWFTPDHDTGKSFLGLEEGIDDMGRLSESQKALSRLRITSESGLYQPESLSVLNKVFRKHYITERTRKSEIIGLYRKVATRAETDLGITNEKFWPSSLCEWPLYHFVCDGF